MFGRWKLYQLDDQSWELCRMRDDGRWKPLGRFYQYNTFHLAIRYAADCELKERAYGEEMELMDALHEYERIVGAMASDVIAAVTGGGR